MFFSLITQKSSHGHHVAFLIAANRVMQVKSGWYEIRSTCCWFDTKLSKRIFGEALVTLREKYVVLPEKYVAGLVTLPEKYVVLSDKYVAGLVCQNNDKLRGTLFWGMTMTDTK